MAVRCAGWEKKTRFLYIKSVNYCDYIEIHRQQNIIILLHVSVYLTPSSERSYVLNEGITMCYKSISLYHMYVGTIIYSIESFTYPIIRLNISTVCQSSNIGPGKAESDVECNSTNIATEYFIQKYMVGNLYKAWRWQRYSRNI